MAAWSGWEAAVLSLIGAPPTAQNVAFLDGWQNAEGGTAAFNPLNTTQGASVATSAYNTFTGSDGGTYHVWNFPDAVTGTLQTVQTLLNGYYPNIVAALRSGNPDAYVNQSAINAELSKWGTGSAWRSASTGSSGSGGLGSATAGGGPSTGTIPGASATAGGKAADTSDPYGINAAIANVQRWIQNNVLYPVFVGSLAIAFIGGGIAIIAASNSTVRSDTEKAVKTGAEAAAA